MGDLANELAEAVADGCLGQPLEEGEGSDCCPDCAASRLIEEAVKGLAEDTGLDPDVLLEAIKCDSKCREKFMDPDGSFKGKSGGPEFKACLEMVRKCCKGVKDPEAFCAYIGRRAGKI